MKNNRLEVFEMGGAGFGDPIRVYHGLKARIVLIGRIDHGEPWWGEPVLAFGQRARVQPDIGATTAGVDDDR